METLIYYVLFPFIVFPFLASVTASIPFMVIGLEVKEFMGPAYLIVFASLYLLLIWFFFVWPWWDHFVLHEHGLRIRLGFKRLCCRFEAIEGIFTGRLPSKVEDAAKATLEYLQPGNIDSMAYLDSATITVVTKDGTQYVFRALLANFEPADLEILFRELVRLNPHLGTAKSKNVD